MIGEIHNVHWRELAEMVKAGPGMVDAVIADCPYSARTHSGHDGQAEAVNGLADKGSGVTGARRAIDYPPWTEADVLAFVGAWAPLTRNWLCSLTDEDLRSPWRAALDAADFNTFARIPAIETAMTVRFNGDGTPNWTCDLVTGRTRRADHIGAWRPRPYYLVTREKKEVVGGKPLEMMRQIVEGYTRPGDLVCDPCCGAGTTLLAAKLLGRRFVGGDLDLAHVEIARERLRDTPTRDRLGTLALPFGDRT